MIRNFAIFAFLLSLSGLIPALAQQKMSVKDIIKAEQQKLNKGSSHLTIQPQKQSTQEENYIIPADRKVRTFEPEYLNLRVPIQYKNEIMNKAISNGRQGGTHGGGGAGFACYYSSNGQAKTKSYVTWEFLEFVAPPLNGSYESFANQNETIIQYIFRVLDSKKTLPFFFRVLLKNTVLEVNSQVNQCANIEFIPDLGERSSNYTKNIAKIYDCDAPVTLARRVPMTAEEHSTKDYKIEFNCPLYQKLGFTDPSFSDQKKLESRKLNQALLILHEAVYLIGARLGTQPNTLSVRYLVNSLLTTNRWISILDRQRLANLGFDNFFKLLGDKTAFDAYVKQSRQISYKTAVTMVGNIRKLFLPINPKDLKSDEAIRDALFFNHPSRWLSEAFILNRPYTDVVNYVNRHNISNFKPPVEDYEKNWESQYLEIVDAINFIVAKKMSTQEAFLYYASSITAETDYGKQPDFDFDSLLIPGIDSKSAMTKVCKDLENPTLYFSKTFYKIIDRAKEYCKQYPNF